MQKIIRSRAIHRKVLVVTVINPEIDWSAHVVPVPGIDHPTEVDLWRTEGARLRESEARAIAALHGTEGLRYRR